MLLVNHTYLTTAEVAGLMGLTTGRIRQFAFRGQLKPAKKVGNVLLFDAAEVLKFAEIPRKIGRPKFSDSAVDNS